MSFEQLMQQAGKVTVNVAPLLVIIGAAMTAADSMGSMSDMLDLLTEEQGEEAGDGGH